MNNNFDEHNEGDQYSINSNSKPRVIEIPVQHCSATSNNEPGINSNSLPKVSGDLRGLYHGKPDQKFPNQDFFNRNFEDFPSHFDLIDPSLRNRSLFNREQPFGSRFDEFFRPNLSPSPHHSSAEQFLNRAGKSPNRDILRQTSPAPPSYIDSERQNRQSPTVTRTESPKLRTESPRLNPGVQIPIQHVPIGSSDFHLRTESPVRQSSTPPVSRQSPPTQTQQQTTNKTPIGLPDSQKISKPHVTETSKSPSDFIKNSPQQSRFEQSPKSSPEPTSQPTPAQLKQQQHKVKPQPVINLPKVIPLPDNQPKSHDTNDMGNTFQGQHSSNTSNKRHAGGPSDFTHPHQPSPQPEPHVHAPPQIVPKTQQEKLNDIEKELELYEAELNTMKPGCGKKDKTYMKLDEFITRCLLKLDEIEKTEDIIHYRKKLIVASNKLLDQLESKASEESKPEASSDTNSETDPPSSKRSKSPNSEDNKEEENCDSNEEKKEEEKPENQ